MIPSIWPAKVACLEGQNYEAETLPVGKVNKVE
jgi:hypothetical protein